MTLHLSLVYLKTQMSKINRLVLLKLKDILSCKCTISSQKPLNVFWFSFLEEIPQKQANLEIQLAYGYLSASRGGACQLAAS